MEMAWPSEIDPEVPAIEAIRNRDSSAFGEFVRRHAGWVRSIAFSVVGCGHDLDDVCQQIWTRVWEQIDGLRDARRWRSWVYRLAKNTAIDAGRRRSRQRVISGCGEQTRLEGPVQGPEAAVDARERNGVVLRAVESLPAIYREPFVLRHVEGWSHREIGSVMGLPEATVETRLVRARRMLRESLKGRV